MSCEYVAKKMIHQYFDQELLYEKEIELKHHLMKCANCQQYFREIKDVHEMLTSVNDVEVPASLKSNIMDQLPKDHKIKRFTKIIKEHPIITAAAIFFILLFTTTLSQYYDDNHLYLTQHEGVITEGNVVIIPEGEVIVGDFIVKNASVVIKGRINGDLTLINSQIINEADDQIPLSATYAQSHVDGKIHEINRYAGWLFYKFKSGFNQIKSLLNFD